MLHMFEKTTRVAPKRLFKERKLLRPHPPTSPRVSPKFEDLSEIENKSCARKRPSRPQRAVQTLAKSTRPISEHLIPLAPRRFHLRAFALEPSLAPIFSSTPGFSREKAKKKRIEARTLRIAQTSPFDVHRRLSHVLEMHSQIRASRFARFRRVVGLSGVLDHRVVGKKNRVLLFCGESLFSFHTKGKKKKESSRSQKKKKKSKLNPKPYSVLASFLTVVFRFF